MSDDSSLRLAPFQCLSIWPDSIAMSRACSRFTNRPVEVTKALRVRAPARGRRSVTECAADFPVTLKPLVQHTIALACRGAEPFLCLLSHLSLTRFRGWTASEQPA